MEILMMVKTTDDGSSSASDAHSSGWRVWRANDTGFLHHSFTANNVGPWLLIEIKCLQL